MSDKPYTADEIAALVAEAREYNSGLMFNTTAPIQILLNFSMIANLTAAVEQLQAERDRMTPVEVRIDMPVKYMVWKKVEGD